jgi:hypothetical protein
MVQSFFTDALFIPTIEAFLSLYVVLNFANSMTNKIGVILLYEMGVSTAGSVTV